VAWVVLIGLYILIGGRKPPQNWLYHPLLYNRLTLGLIGTTGVSLLWPFRQESEKRRQRRLRRAALAARDERFVAEPASDDEPPALRRRSKRRGRRRKR
jgi:hypothetical protein